MSVARSAFVRPVCELSWQDTETSFLLGGFPPITVESLSRYFPFGIMRYRTPSTIACLNAAVSSVVPSPLAPYGF